MPAIKIGIQLASLRLPFKQALMAANQLGATAVEIDARHGLKPSDVSQTALRQLRKTLDDLNLRVCAVSYQTRRGYNVADDLDARLAGTKGAMRLAQSLGAAVVINQIGQVPATSEGPEWNMLLEVLSDLGRFGQHYGALLAANTGSESGADLARLIAALPDGALAVNFDPGNLLVNGFPPYDALDALNTSIWHVHVRDAVADRARGRGREVEVGRGSVDFPALLGKLEEYDYRGYFTVVRDESPDPQFEIGQAIKFLRSL